MHPIDDALCRQRIVTGSVPTGERTSRRLFVGTSFLSA
jgi:hypothetical protein